MPADATTLSRLIHQKSERLNDSGKPDRKVSNADRRGVPRALFRQIQKAHNRGFTTEEREKYTRVIRAEVEVLKSMQERAELEEAQRNDPSRYLRS